MNYLEKNIANYYDFGVEYLFNLASNHDIKLYLFIINAVSKNFVTCFTINSLENYRDKDIIQFKRLDSMFLCAREDGNL